MRAVVMEDHEIVRDAIRRLLQERLGFNDVLEAGDLPGGLDLLSGAGKVELVIVDLDLPGNAGPESLADLVDRYPQSSVVVMSGSEARADVMGSISAGVDGYIPKSLPAQEIVAGIEQVLNGGMFVPRRLTRSARTAARPSAAGVEHLTPRQRETLDELLLGKSSKEIARALGVTEGTIKLHLAAIYRALGVHSRAEAMAKLMAGDMRAGWRR